MKKILLFAILAVTVNVFAQSKQSIQRKSVPKANTIQTIQARMLEMAAKTPGLRMSSGQAINFPTPDQPLSGPVELIDSTLTWKMNLADNSWMKKLKTTHVEYDNNNRRTKDVQQTWNGSAWVDTIQNSYSWDASSTVYTSVSKTWIGGAWVNKLQASINMDSNGNILSYAWQSWNGTAWVNVMKFIDIYDGNNNVVNETLQWGNGELWTNSLQTVFTYLDMDKTSEEDQSWNEATSLWESSNKTTFAYDADHNQTSLLEQNWNPDLSIWENVTKITYSYDGFDNLLTEEDQEFGDGDWQNYSLTSYTTVNGHITEETGQYWDGSSYSYAWYNAYTFDGNDNQTGELDQEWDSFNNVWNDVSQNISTFDAKNNQTSNLNQQWDGSAWQNTLLDLVSFDANSYAKGRSHKVWNNGGDFLLFSGDSTFNYYHVVLTGIDIQPDADIHIYPNPSHGKVKISGKNSIGFVEIYSVTGNRIYADHHFILQASGEIDLSAYAKGVYIMKIMEGAKSYTRKLVVQ